MNRRKFLAAIGLCSLGGCLSRPEQFLLRNSDFTLINSRDSLVRGSARITEKNGNTIAQKTFLLESGETTTLTAMLQTVEGFLISVEVNRPRQKTYESRITEKSDKYQIEIRSNDIAVVILT